ncbi:Arc family DNA-binding protein [Gilliamella sp. B2776]|uniref:Arc family DNA-binding protein n=1 Tax=unclassified Gilliamella TaxID=2685620 RepID=UPI00226AF6D2|nr:MULTISPECIES: Arc family DNA-binding protein [unclassified Gilliamella]MCX8649947.1 Arc family DNA-binding protein [Gilliamella sp. B2779]MCX8653805.1 Arc family DNA-binding protein [Gilliamella sp. B2737]MCX8691720.1 Arc family DNA-binding protein [Gilliamella sp. B2776]MCX8701683.1 Arc family DNA-binding protein [Gilliamella sp. B2840]MCX8703039.1 Arc family DNA-binding protein [Gilliamella sp. B2781]
MTKIKAGRDIAPFGVRIPSDLKEKLQKLADQKGRSLNAEIVYRLSQSVNQDNANVIHDNKDLFIELIKLTQKELQKNKNKD